MMTLLEGLRNALATIPGVQSCKIGLEDNITPDDYPIVRVVPSRMSDGRAYSTRLAETMIYFGMPIQPFDDTPDGAGRIRLEKLYAALFDLEAAIIEKLQQAGGMYRETIADEDRLDTYKIFAIRCEVDG